MKSCSFSPIASASARVLILGTMPGLRSLELQQYYAHPQNVFWKIFSGLLKHPYSLDYSERKKMLLQNEIAVWDVLQYCERIGSLDSAIKKEIANDISSFLKMHPHITHIFFNGQKAATYFKRYICTHKEYIQITLPSTSPANARLPFATKLDAWNQIGEYLLP
ncbi:MAG: DNA-deoxyinosine glycosylase [Flavobacteriales bacterium]|nr:DNA-deoxyinosine glycosylase [Flavobacteriales bacterium]